MITHFLSTYTLYKEPKPAESVNANTQNTYRCRQSLLYWLKLLIGPGFTQQREMWLVESEGRPHVVSGVFDLQLQLSDPRLHNTNKWSLTN